MTSTFEIYGEVATEVTTNPNGELVLILDTRFGLKELTAPPTGEVGAEVGVLCPGDRISLEVERDGQARVVVGVRPAYIRGIPGR